MPFLRASRIAVLSLPTRGAWIEISRISWHPPILESRSPHGERGLKCRLLLPSIKIRSRSPHGERGLKSVTLTLQACAVPSLPTRGAWIEILQRLCYRSLAESRSPHGERGLKYRIYTVLLMFRRSLPTRGAWIEMPVYTHFDLNLTVAPHTGSVDLLTRVFFYPTLEHCTLTSTGYRYLFCNGQTSSQAWTYIAFRARLFLLSISSCLRWLAISML